MFSCIGFACSKRKR